MAEIIVKLPDEVYEDIKATYNGTDVIYCAVKYGTPLPKGHGRLIDANAYAKDVKKHYFDNDMVIRCMNIASQNAPTIIEADKETKDED